MIDPLRRPVAPATTSTEKPATAAPAASTATSAYNADGLSAPAKAPVLKLSGIDLPGPIDLPSIKFPNPFSTKPADRVGPKFLHLGDTWTPQGQGYDSKRGQVLTTYYSEGKDAGVLLSVQAKNGDEAFNVRLGGLPGGRPPTHGGGVSTEGDFIYVADTEDIYAYRREDVEAAARNGTVAQPVQVMPVPRADVKDPKTGIDLVSSASYMAVKDGYAYVGAYSKNGDGKTGGVWRYKIDEATGQIDPASRQGPIRAPDRAQGVTVVDGALIFTTGDKKLVYQPIDEPFSADIDERTDIAGGRLDSWAQGINVIDGELWVTYESGSHKYKDLPGVHERNNIQRIPLESLDLDAAGLDPEDLER